MTLTQQLAAGPAGAHRPLIISLFAVFVAATLAITVLSLIQCV